MAEIELRPTARADVRPLCKVLARAFYDDPVMMYMLPTTRPGPTLCLRCSRP